MASLLPSHPDADAGIHSISIPCLCCHPSRSLRCSCHEDHDYRQVFSKAKATSLPLHWPPFAAWETFCLTFSVRARTESHKDILKAAWLLDLSLMSILAHHRKTCYNWESNSQPTCCEVIRTTPPFAIIITTAITKTKKGTKRKIIS